MLASFASAAPFVPGNLRYSAAPLSDLSLFPSNMKVAAPSICSSATTSAEEVIRGSQYSPSSCNNLRQFSGGSQSLPSSSASLRQFSGGSTSSAVSGGLLEQLGLLSPSAPPSPLHSEILAAPIAEMADYSPVPPCPAGYPVVPNVGCGVLATSGALAASQRYCSSGDRTQCSSAISPSLLSSPPGLEALLQAPPGISQTATPSLPDPVALETREDAFSKIRAIMEEQTARDSLDYPQFVLGSYCGKGLKKNKLPEGTPVKKMPPNWGAL